MRGLQIGFCRVLADGYWVGKIGDCSREWFDMVESLRDNLCYYEKLEDKYKFSIAAARR